MAADGPTALEISVREFLERYARFFNGALAGTVGTDELADLYAAEFIAAGPAGVMTGKNDERLEQVMAQGYARYRALGTKAMRIRDVRITPIDERHCLAHVAWTATYARSDRTDLAIEFDVHYLIQILNGTPKVFGWVAGDEEALLREHGIV